MTKKWFTETVASTVSNLGTSTENGLSSEEVKKRQEQFGSNELQEQAGKSVLELLAHQFKNPLIFILGSVQLFPSSLVT